MKSDDIKTVMKAISIKQGEIDEYYILIGKLEEEIETLKKAYAILLHTKLDHSDLTPKEQIEDGVSQWEIVLKNIQSCPQARTPAEIHERLNLKGLSPAVLRAVINRLFNEGKIARSKLLSGRAFSYGTKTWFEENKFTYQVSMPDEDGGYSISWVKPNKKSYGNAVAEENTGGGGQERSH